MCFFVAGYDDKHHTYNYIITQSTDFNESMNLANKYNNNIRRQQNEPSG